MSQPKNRPNRTPIHMRNVMTVKSQDANKVLRWVNDTDDRVQAFKDAGYTVVQRATQVGDNRADTAKQLGSAVERPVGGGGRAVLMEIDKDFYQQDQADKEKRIKTTEESMFPKVDTQEQARSFYGRGAEINHGSRQRIQNIDGDE